MTSLHQIPNEEPVHEQESAVEKYQSRWSSNKTRFIADKPPSQPRSSYHRQMSGRPSSGTAVKESSQHKYPGMDSGEVLLEESNGAIQNRLPMLGLSSTVRHCNRSEQHQQSLSQTMMMDLPALRSIPGHQMSLKEQQEHVLSMIQLALDIMPDVNAPSFDRVSSNTKASNTRFIVDRPPSQPLSRQRSGIPSVGIVKESHNKDPGTKPKRRGSAAGRLQRNNSKWTPGVEVVTDSPPLQPLSEGFNRVVQDGARFLKPPLTRQRTKRSFARDKNYPQLLQKLIVQGLIRIDESDEVDQNEVTVFCHGEDETTVKSVPPGTVKKYAEIMKWESTDLLEPVVSVNADRPEDLTDTTYGGIFLADDRATKLGLGTQALRRDEES